MPDLIPAIGGPRDGERLCIPPDKNEIQLPAVDPTAVVDYQGQTILEQSIYVRRFIVVDGKHYSLWVHSSMSLADAVQKLIAKYPKD